jgi:nucleoside-diphosphate-sugar epimerase
MVILGRGLIARGLRPYEGRAPDVTVFARGVADSTTTDDREFSRECRLLYEAIAGCLRHGRKLVYLSGGGAVYGPFDGPKDERSPLFPRSAYGRHQVTCEAIVRASGARHLILRLPNVVGAPQNPMQLVPNLVLQALRGEATVYRDAARDLIDIADVARMIVGLAELVEDDIVVVATGRSTPVPRIFADIERILGTAARVTVLPGGESQRFGIGRLRELLPEVAFDDRYASRLLARYVPELAGVDLGVA